jgi:hypothetical protein
MTGHSGPVAVSIDPKAPVSHLVRMIIVDNKRKLGPAFRAVMFHPILHSPSRIQRGTPP